MSAAAFAFVELNAERLAQLGVNLLAVAGGYLVGFVAAGLLAWLIDRWVTGGKSPIGLKRVLRHLGGIALALLVALIVFGHGHGWNLFGGGGPGDGDGKTEEKGEGGPAPVETRPDPQPIELPPRKEVPVPQERVRVTVLGGTDVKEMRFYLIDDDRVPKTLGELEQAVKARQAAAKQPIGIDVRYSPNGGVGKDAPGTIRLVNWAQRSGLSVILPGDPK